ncbi:MAG: hypothetical protein WA904_13700 [Polaromonas sp.]
MATIPWHETWMRDTYSWSDARSEKLKAVDLAIFIYDSDKSEESRLRIKQALDDYRFDHSRRGKDWTKSVRNKKGALTNLHRAVNNVDQRRLTEADLLAMREMVTLQQHALKEMFAGKELSLKSFNKKKHASEIKTLLSKTQGAAANIRDINVTRSGTRTAQGVNAVAGTAITQKFDEMVKAVCGALDPAMIMRELGLGSVADFAKSMAPALGIIASASDTAVGVGKIVYGKWKAAQMHEVGTYAIAAGDPLAAFQALEVLIDREINSTIATTAIAGAAFTAKTLCSALDLGAASGPAIGLAETIAKAIQHIVEFVRDCEEVQMANRLLTQGTLDLSLFRSCPLLGCYYVAVQDHSTLINMAVADFGTPNFVVDADRLVAAVKPVIAKAGQFVRSSRFEIEGMQNHKGIKLAAWEKMSTSEKASNLKQHVTDGMIDMVTTDSSKTPLPQVDRSRIVGFGSDNPPPPTLLRSGGRVVPPPLPPRPAAPLPARAAPPLPPRPVKPAALAAAQRMGVALPEFSAASRAALPQRIE